MSDITTFWSVDRMGGDWALAGPDLASGDSLATAVQISLFTDQVAGPDDIIPDGSQDPRGWWGDQGADRPIGSKLWLRSRSNQTQAMLNAVHDDIVEALQWLIDDGVAASVAVACAWVRSRVLGATITITRPSGETQVLRFDWAWQELGQVIPPPAPVAPPVPPSPPAPSGGGTLDFSDPANSGLLALFLND